MLGNFLQEEQEMVSKEDNNLQLIGEAKNAMNVNSGDDLSLEDRIRESVDSLCRDGADAQYILYLSKSHITSLQTR